MLSSLPFIFMAVATASPFPTLSTSNLQHPVRRAIEPKVSGTPKLLGIASDPTWTRDSCTSVRVRDRELWTCRDSMCSGGFLSSTASWTKFTADGTPAVSQGNLTMYGTNSDSYFAIQPDECGPGASGKCSDGTRFAIWPNTRPLPVDVGSEGAMSLYTWINKAHIRSDFSAVVQNPAASLYRSDFKPGRPADELPPVTLVDEEFWPEDSILYGNYGFVNYKGTSYLYGHLNGSTGIALAKVPASSIEDKTAYRYWTGSYWSLTSPSLTDSSAAIPNAGSGGQGTFYYTSHFQSFIWIGAPAIGCTAAFLIATAPAPEGPWTEPTQFYEGEAGSSDFCAAYSQQAHPGLSEDYGSGGDIYLTYTKVDEGFSTPLIRVVWQ